MTSSSSPSRRTFLGGVVAAGAAAMLPRHASAAPEQAAMNSPLDFPLADLHAHLDNSSIDQVLPLGKERNVKFGIVEHAGDKDNKYPVVLSNDQELRAYITMLDGKGVWKGVQAEWSNWMNGFSREALAQLDYVLTDTMTFPGKEGQRVKLWEKQAAELVDLSNHEAFMDRYVDWHVQIISTEPFDILANVSWLPEAMAEEYDTLWTDKRIGKVLDAAVKFGVAIEISSSFKLPGRRFIKQAKAAGLKFTFGSNGRYPNMGKLQWSIDMAKEMGLKAADMFTPAPDGQKAVQRRKW